MYLKYVYIRTPKPIITFKEIIKKKKKEKNVKNEKNIYSNNLLAGKQKEMF